MDERMSKATIADSVGQRELTIQVIEQHVRVISNGMQLHIFQPSGASNTLPSFIAEEYLKRTYEASGAWLIAQSIFQRKSLPVPHNPSPPGLHGIRESSATWAWSISARKEGDKDDWVEIRQKVRR